MRLISQDGMIDVPYEQVAIELKESEVWCDYSATVQSYCTGRMMAKYTTEAKAQKAMEMLCEEYRKHIFGQGGAMATANFYVPPFAFIPPKVFQFPKDEDMEE